MKLATFLPPGSSEPCAGEVGEDRVRAFSDSLSVSDVLAGAEPEADGGEWGLEEVQLLAPVQAPGTIYAIGLNYALHVKETGGQKPEAPIVFVKVAGAACDPSGPVRCPEVVHRLDYEGELAIVIGAGGSIG